MPVDAYPDGAGLSCQLVIESKGFHGRSTRWGQSRHGKAILAPLEMLSPGNTVAGNYVIWVLDGNRVRDSQNFSFTVPDGQGEVWIEFDQG